MADKEKKQSRLGRFFRETSGELRKVSWPTRQEAINLTVIVIIVMILMGMYLSLIDAGAAALLQRLLGL